MKKHHKYRNYLLPLGINVMVKVVLQIHHNIYTYILTQQFFTPNTRTAIIFANACFRSVKKPKNIN